jgi:predicted extracellular nuclease
MRLLISLFFILTSFLAFSQTNLTIPQIQGSGSASPYVNQQVRTTGIVTAKFIGSVRINGYFLQDALGDDNAATSDGIFVYTSTDNVNVGDKIQVTATVLEYYGKTELTNITSKIHIASNQPLPVTKVVYQPDNFDWERYEGMMIEFDQVLYVSDHTNFEQSGQLSLFPIRKFSPTNQFLPGSNEYSASVVENSKTSILLDDGITTSYFKPLPLADVNGSRSMGERVSNLRAVVDYSASRYVLYPAPDSQFFMEIPALQAPD